MERALLLTCFVLAGTSLSQEPANPDPTGIFEDSELDVPKAEEKKARETVAKKELEADAALPDDVRRTLDRLTVFELVENTVLGKRVGAVRATLCEQLLELAHAAREAKADGVAVAKYVEDLPSEEPLRPEKIAIGAQPGDDTMIWNDDKGTLWNTLLPNGRIEKISNDGRWKWLNPQRTIFLVDYYGNSIADIVTLKSPGAMEASAFSSNGGRWQVRRSSVSAAVRKPPPYALGVLAEAARSEAELREHAAREIATRRKSVAAWLEEKAKTAPPAAIGRILDHSRSLTPAGGRKWPSRSERIAGTWNVEDGKKLELRLDGTVVINGQKNKAIWKWAKAKNYTTALVLFGNPDDPSDIWVVRTPSKEPGVLRIATRDSYRKATLSKANLN